MHGLRAGVVAHSEGLPPICHCGPHMNPPAYRFPFQRPELPAPHQWAPLLDTAYAAHRFSNHGPLALELEQRLAERVGRNVVLAANGTAAITAALLVLERKGAVILPSFTFPATLGAVLQAGLQPVLADVNPLTWELDVPTIESAAAVWLAACRGARGAHLRAVPRLVGAAGLVRSAGRAAGAR